MENQSIELCTYVCVPTFHWAGRICCGCSRSSPDQRSSSPLELFSPENSSLFIQCLKTFRICSNHWYISWLVLETEIHLQLTPGHGTTPTPKRYVNRHGLSQWPLANGPAVRLVTRCPPGGWGMQVVCGGAHVHNVHNMQLCSSQCADSRWVSGLFNPTATIAFICV